MKIQGRAPSACGAGVGTGEHRAQTWALDSDSKDVLTNSEGWNTQPTSHDFRAVRGPDLFPQSYHKVGCGVGEIKNPKTESQP